MTIFFFFFFFFEKGFYDRNVTIPTIVVLQRQSNSRALIEDYDQEDMWTPKPIFSHGFHKRRGKQSQLR